MKISSLSGLTFKQIPPGIKDQCARERCTNHVVAAGLAPPTDEEWAQVRANWMGSIRSEHARARAIHLRQQGGLQ